MQNNYKNKLMPFFFAIFAIVFLCVLIFLNESSAPCFILCNMFKNNIFIKTDIKMFIYCAIFLSVLSKTVGCNLAYKKSRADIFFLFILFCFLFIPTLKISNDTVSLEENRNMAKLKPLISKEGKFNYDFAKDFDSYFNDRFTYRMLMINIYYALKDLVSFNIYNQENIYYDKSSHWAFDSGFSTHLDYKDKFADFKTKIENLNEFCRKNNIKLYVLISPNKAEVYSNEAKKCLSKKITNNGDNFAKYLKAQNIDYAISPLDDLKKEKEYVFPKGDAHWNDLGGFIAYRAVMSRIKKDFKDIKILDKTDFNITLSKFSKNDYDSIPNKGCFYERLNLPNKVLDTYYLVFDYKNKNNVKRIPTALYPEEIAYSKDSNKYTLYIIGNSFEENVTNFLMPTFKKTIKKRYNTIYPYILHLKRYEEDILKEKPDILLLIITSQGINDIENL